MRCLSCKYDLSNLSSGGGHRCPECGRAFDPNDPATFGPREPSPWLVFFVAFATFLAIFGLILMPIAIEIWKGRDC